MLKTIFEVKAAVITKQFLFKPEKKDTKSGKIVAIYLFSIP